MNALLFLLLTFSISEPSVIKLPMLIVEATDETLEKSGGVLFQKGLPFTGFIIESYNKQQLKSKTTYLNGKRHQWDFGWHPDGTLRYSRFYKIGEKEGQHLGFWPNGNLQYEYFFREGLHHGSAKQWYRDACNYTSFHFDNGLESGTQQSWNPDGSLKANFVTVGGHRYGLIGLKLCKAPT